MHVINYSRLIKELGWKIKGIKEERGLVGIKAALRSGPRWAKFDATAAPGTAINSTGRKHDNSHIDSEHIF